MSEKQARYLAGNGMTRKSRAKAQINLRDQVKHHRLFSESTAAQKTPDLERELFPSPCAQDYKHRGPNSRQKGLPDVVRLRPAPAAAGNYGRSGAGTPSGGSLKAAVKTYPDPGNTAGPSVPPDTGATKNFFLTPKATDTGKGEKQETFLKRMGDRSAACFQSLPAQAGGQLNAVWVEALMGYPQNWTDIEHGSSFQNRYPEAWLSGEWEDGIPRTITGQKHRPRRIKALGNSIVPQIPCVLFRSKEFDRWR
jgi:hypothetical protein